MTKVAFKNSNESLNTLSNRPNKRDKVKEIFLEWSLRMNLNCYTKIFIYRHNVLVKFIWIFILLTSSFITFWFITKSILDYFNYSVVSQIGTAYEIKSVFPTVTICDYNPFTTRQAQMLYEEVAKNYSIHIDDPKLVIYAKLYVSSPIYSEQKKKSYGLNLSQIQCKFANKPCDMSTDFEWLWMYTYGNCWQFNSGLGKMNSNLAQTYNGLDFGLDLKVSLTKIENKYLFSSDNLFQGLIVFIHNQSFNPQGMEVSQAFVKPGEKSFIGVKRAFNFKHPYPYSQCIDLSDYSSDLHDLIASNRTYRQLDCFKLCRQKFYIKKCGCNLYNDYLNVDTDVRFCLNSKDLACFLEIYYNYSREECEKMSCPLECNSIEYDLSLTSLSQPDYIQSTKNNNIANIVVYYPTLEYTIIKESPQTTELGLFAKIGGTLSLFIGLSLFTLFEMVEILILIIYTLLQ
jgi:hypothetical protein